MSIWPNQAPYGKYVNKYAVPAVIKLYGQRGVWQDDPATIHLTASALEDCSAFNVRIPHNKQASKMAYVWPIKSIWERTELKLRSLRIKLS